MKKNKVTPEQDMIFRDLQFAISEEMAAQKVMDEASVKVEKLKQQLAEALCPFQIGDTVEGGAHTRIRGKIIKICYARSGKVPSYCLTLCFVKTVKYLSDGSKRLGRERVATERLFGFASEIELISPALANA